MYWFFVILLNFTLRDQLKNVGGCSLRMWWRLLETLVCSVSSFLNTVPSRNTQKNSPYPRERTEGQLHLNSAEKEADLPRRASISGLLQITLQSLGTQSPGSCISTLPVPTLWDTLRNISLFCSWGCVSRCDLLKDARVSNLINNQCPCYLFNKTCSRKRSES